MNTLPLLPTPSTVYRRHWLAFWKPLSFLSFFSILSLVGFLYWPPLGIVFLLADFGTALAVFCSWCWSSYTFTTDHRLIYRHGFMGSTTNIISLFGVVTPHQYPLFGGLFDIGGVHLSVAGTSLHLTHIANFEAFYNELVQGVKHEQRISQAPVQVIVQLPPASGQRIFWPQPHYPEMLNGRDFPEEGPAEDPQNFAL
jgi:hypothetical protein